MHSNGWFKHNGFKVKGFSLGDHTCWLAVNLATDSNQIGSDNLCWLINSIDSIIGFYWAFRPQKQPTTYAGQIPVPETEQIETPNPHPLEPKPEKKCSCGAASCGHSGHSSWCDSLE